MHMADTVTKSKPAKRPIMSDPPATNREISTLMKYATMAVETAKE
jgi:hypothetical protein